MELRYLLVERFDSCPSLGQSHACLCGAPLFGRVNQDCSGCLEPTGDVLGFRFQVGQFRLSRFHSSFKVYHCPDQRLTAFPAVTDVVQLCLCQSYRLGRRLVLLAEPFDRLGLLLRLGQSSLRLFQDMIGLNARQLAADLRQLVDLLFVCQTLRPQLTHLHRRSFGFLDCSGELAAGFARGGEESITLRLCRFQQLAAASPTEDIADLFLQRSTQGRAPGFAETEPLKDAPLLQPEQP